MTILATDLKNTFARFATGVTVVSCLPPGDNARPQAMTVNSFTSVSLDPPLVLWCIDKHSRIFKEFDTSSNYAVSILGADDQKWSEHFATPGQHGFDDIDYDTLTTGAPLLKGRIAGLDCEIASRHDAGDHVILVGRVVKVDYQDEKPLLYVGRQYLAGPLITEE